MLGSMTLRRRVIVHAVFGIELMSLKDLVHTTLLTIALWAIALDAVVSAMIRGLCFRRVSGASRR